MGAPPSAIQSDLRVESSAGSSMTFSAMSLGTVVCCGAGLVFRPKNRMNTRHLQHLVGRHGLMLLAAAHGFQIFVSWSSWFAVNIVAGNEARTMWTLKMFQIASLSVEDLAPVLQICSPCDSYAFWCTSSLWERRTSASSCFTYCSAMMRIWGLGTRSVPHTRLRSVRSAASSLVV